MASATLEVGPLGLENPMGTDGFEFVEYAAPDPELLRSLFTKMGFPAVAKHKRKDVTLHRQGDINFIINAEPDSFAEQFATDHGPCACAMAFRVKDAARRPRPRARAWRDQRQERRRRGRARHPRDRGHRRVAALSRRHLWREGHRSTTPTSTFFPDAAEKEASHASHLVYLDHLTHNVHRGRMAHWADFYERLFNFREIRYFDIEGKQTGLISKAMTSPCGKLRIPLNESRDDKSQIEEFLRDYKGEGIQHIALGSDDIYATVDALRGRGIKFQDTPDTYYELVDKRVEGHGEPTAELEKRRILVDGAPTEGQGLLLQIFTQNVIGPIFFEIIQRKGNEGFGEGNFKALFESIELDQIRRGVI